MARWFRTTAEVPLMSKTYVGKVFPRTVLFLNTGASIAPNQQIPVGETESYPYGLESLQVLPIYFGSHPTLGTCTLYILAELANKNSPHCRMTEMEVVPPW